MNGLKQDFNIVYNKESDYFEANKIGAIIIDDIRIGEFGILSENILKLYKLSSGKFIAGYIDLDYIKKEVVINKEFSKWSQYPSVIRDLSLVVPGHLTHSRIYDKIFLKGGENLVDVRLYDMYQAEKLGTDKKSMTYTLEFNSKERTMTSEEVDASIDEIIKVLNNEFGITLRPQ